MQNIQKNYEGGLPMNKRLALVFGNAKYRYINPLTNTLNDARGMKNKLESLGFDVMLGLDVTKQEMESMRDTFVRRLNDYDVGLFYFSGHGAQSMGQNILCPVDMPALTTAMDFSQLADVLMNGGFLVDEYLARIAKYESGKINICILDACRSDPLLPPPGRDTKSFAPDMRLVPIEDIPHGTIISFATSPYKVSYDSSFIGGQSGYGAYTGELLRWIDKPDMKIEEMFKNVRKEVSKHTFDKQITWDHSSLIGDFYFNPTSAALKSATVSAADNRSLPREVIKCPCCAARMTFEAGAESCRCEYCGEVTYR